jgi:hypothetical protein
LSGNTLTASIGYVLEGAGTFTINGDPGSEGNVIAISAGYPAWINPNPIISLTFPTSTIGNANQVTETPLPGGIFPVKAQDTIASSYTVIFDVGAALETPVTFFVKSLDASNNIYVQWTDGATNTDAIFFGPIAYLQPAAATNGYMCACRWDGTNLTVY